MERGSTAATSDSKSGGDTPFGGRQVDVCLVFPDPHYQPPGILEFSGLTLIPPDVLAELRSPEKLSGTRTDIVLRAAMPEAAVHEDGNPTPNEGDVNSRSTNSEVDPVAEPPVPKPLA